MCSQQRTELLGPAWLRAHAVGDNYNKESSSTTEMFSPTVLVSLEPLRIPNCVLKELAPSI